VWNPSRDRQRPNSIQANLPKLAFTPSLRWSTSARKPLFAKTLTLPDTPLDIGGSLMSERTCCFLVKSAIGLEREIFFRLKIPQLALELPAICSPVNHLSS
jgi:hypothetical protein